VDNEAPLKDIQQAERFQPAFYTRVDEETSRITRRN
jgi:hypothetical protein